MSEAEAAQDQPENIGSYVYGILRSGQRIPEDLDPVPPGSEGAEHGLGLVSAGPIAAVVSDIATDRPLGKREDLLAHERRRVVTVHGRVGGEVEDRTHPDRGRRADGRPPGPLTGQPGADQVAGRGAQTLQHPDPGAVGSGDEVVEGHVDVDRVARARGPHGPGS